MNPLSFCCCNGWRHPAVPSDSGQIPVQLMGLDLQLHGDKLFPSQEQEEQERLHSQVCWIWLNACQSEVGLNPRHQCTISVHHLPLAPAKSHSSCWSWSQQSVVLLGRVATSSQGLHVETQKHSLSRSHLWVIYSNQFTWHAGVPGESVCRHEESMQTPPEQESNHGPSCCEVTVLDAIQCPKKYR